MTEYDASSKPQSHTFFADRGKELEEIAYSCYAPQSRSVIGGAQMGKTAILIKVESLLWDRFSKVREYFLLDPAELESEIVHVKGLIKKKQRIRRIAEGLLADSPGDLRLTVQLEVVKESLVELETRLRNLQTIMKSEQKSENDPRLIPIYFDIAHKESRADSLNILFGKILRKARSTVNRHLELSNVEELGNFQPSVDNPQVTPSKGEGVIEAFEIDLKSLKLPVENALNCKIRPVFLLDNAQSLAESVRDDFAKFLLDLMHTDFTATESQRNDYIFVITCDEEVDKLFPRWGRRLRRMPTTKLHALSSEVGKCEFVVPLLANRFGEVAQEWIDQIAEAICKWAGGHPKLLKHFVDKVSLEDRDIDESWIQQYDELDECVYDLLDSCIQSCDLRAWILETLAEAKKPVSKTELYEKAPATHKEVWTHLKALKYHGLVWALDKGYVLAGDIFRPWLPW